MQGLQLQKKRLLQCKENVEKETVARRFETMLSQNSQFQETGSQACNQLWDYA
jgi:hypothetical protein